MVAEAGDDPSTAKRKIAKDGTSTSPAWHNFANYQKALREKYPFINKVANYVPPRTWDGKDFVLPGLVATKSYDFKTKRSIQQLQ